MNYKKFLEVLQMTRNQIKRQFQKAVIEDMPNCYWIEKDFGSKKAYFLHMMDKFNKIPFELISNETKGLKILRIVDEWKAPKVARKINPDSKKAYFKLDEVIDYSTEKAIGIVTGSNNLHGNAYREYVEWIPTSQILDINGKVYLPAWLISKKGFWKYVDKEDKITQ
jgi:hypothetical protein